MYKLIILITISISGCASIRSNAILGLKFSDQPVRAQIRSECNGKQFTTEGTIVCEQKIPSEALISVKVPPLEGRVIYSNGQLKKVDDFNWYPKEGFWIFKNKPIKDTWIPLDLGAIKSDFGDWPVALNIVAIDEKVGIINTRGLIYHRICNDIDVPCSKLIVEYQCVGISKHTGIGEIGKCDRIAGSTQSFVIKLSTLDYKATEGGKLYITIPRNGFSKVFSLGEKEINDGEIKFETTEILPGPTLIGFRLSWLEKSEKKSVETRVLISGSDPEWTGIDKPHYLVSKDSIEWVKPVQSDIMEVNIYDSNKVIKGKKFSREKVIESEAIRGTDIGCAFSWQRDSSDLTAICLDSNQKEVKVP